MQNFIFRFLALLVIPLISIADTPSKNKDYAIQVRLYRGHPIDNFQALEDLGKILVQETSKGFVMRSVIDRDSYHPGATFCILVDPRLFDAKDELKRILSRIQQLNPDGHFVEFQVNNPSSCMVDYFPGLPSPDEQKAPNS